MYRTLAAVLCLVMLSSVSPAKKTLAVEKNTEGLSYAEPMIPETGRDEDDRPDRRKGLSGRIPTAEEAGELVASGRCGDRLTWELRGDTLIISGTGDMWDFNEPGSFCWDPYLGEDHIGTIILPEGLTRIGNYAFCGFHGLERVTIPRGVTTIGENAFWNCTSLRSVNIPNGVTEIGYGAFAGCESLTSVAVPSSVKTIGEYAFYDCGSLTSAIIYEGVKRIGGGAFAGCENLTSVTIPDSVAEICDYTFLDCESLLRVSLPKRATRIGDSAFRNCRSLKDVVIPDSVIEIGESAFADCDGLTGILIPENVTTIGDRAFCGCNGLIGIEVDPNNAAYCSVDGVLYDKNQIVLIQCPGGTTGTGFILDGVICIGDAAFADCTGLTGIAIPESVTDIGRDAFKNCTGLTDIEISDGVAEIASGTFSGCEALLRATLPASVTTIGEKAFSDCTNLESVTIPASVKSIGSFVFDGCTELHEIRFLGSAPDFAASFSDAALFDGLDATVFYPLDDATWTEQVREGFGGTIEWMPCLDGRPAPNPFTDIAEGKDYYVPALWAFYHDPQIIGETGSAKFSPKGKCTRAEVVTYLWRAAGCPMPAATQNPFTDVKAGAAYYDAVLWAWENGIVPGTGKTAFGPKKTCSREQAITYLWRAAGKPEPATAGLPFIDVSAQKSYYHAILWAVEHEIVFGTGEEKFSPDTACTRAQVITFLYRYLGR